jgi:geranylgeranyl pyrophosphate synthase
MQQRQTPSRHLDEPTTQAEVPASRADRLALREHLRRYAADHRLAPPLGLGELIEHTRRCLDAHGLDRRYDRYAAVLLSNALWEDTLAGVPFERRLLLLPQCLRNTQTCSAAIDAYGLTCDACGGCVINEFLAEADRLGYVTLVAEGSALVMSLIETGKVEAIIGVSCLDALEQVFPYMEAGAIPGLAIPLLHDGCENTTLDADWVWRAIYLASEDHAYRQNLDALSREVKTWFSHENLAELLGPASSRTEQLARNWLARAGKRWRPVLLTAAWQALSESADEDDIPLHVHQLAVAVECFHKASLIHDDIEDNDDRRYGQATLHTAEGVPVALNVGDLLIGEGYRLIAQASQDPTASRRAADMLAVAAEGHRTLCLGQGDDLDWTRHPTPLDLDNALDIVRRKTAPPFEVALKLGCLAADVHEPQLAAALHDYSQAVGIAYQVRDDLDDFLTPAGQDDLAARRPSVLLALASRAATNDAPAAASAICAAMQQAPIDETARADIRKALKQLNVERLAREQLDDCKQQALQAIARLDRPALKALLRRLLGKIFYDVDTLTCCTDRRPPNAPDARNHS